MAITVPDQNSLRNVFASEIAKQYDSTFMRSVMSRDDYEKWKQREELHMIRNQIDSQISDMRTRQRDAYQLAGIYFAMLALLGGLGLGLTLLFQTSTLWFSVVVGAAALYGLIVVGLRYYAARQVKILEAKKVMLS